MNCDYITRLLSCIYNRVMCGHDLDYSVQANKSLHYIFFFLIQSSCKLHPWPMTLGTLYSLNLKENRDSCILCRAISLSSMILQLGIMMAVTGWRITDCVLMCGFSPNLLYGVKVEKSVLFVQSLIYYLTYKHKTNQQLHIMRISQSYHLGVKR